MKTINKKICAALALFSGLALTACSKDLPLNSELIEPTRDDRPIVAVQNAAEVSDSALDLKVAYAEDNSIVITGEDRNLTIRLREPQTKDVVLRLVSSVSESSLRTYNNGRSEAKAYRALPSEVVRFSSTEITIPAGKTTANVAIELDDTQLSALRAGYYLTEVSLAESTDSRPSQRFANIVLKLSKEDYSLRPQEDINFATKTKLDLSQLAGFTAIPAPTPRNPLSNLWDGSLSTVFSVENDGESITVTFPNAISLSGLRIGRYLQGNYYFAMPRADIRFVLEDGSVWETEVKVTGESLSIYRQPWHQLQLVRSARVVSITVTDDPSSYAYPNYRQPLALAELEVYTD